MPAASPASTRLQYRASKYMGYLRKAMFSEVPVSTSARMSLSSLVTLGLLLPRPTMSNDCRRGTLVCMLVAIWRVDSALSLGGIFLRDRTGRLLLLVGRTPWRRRVAFTWFPPAARTSPRANWPLGS